MPDDAKPQQTLREAAVTEALAIIRDRGIENLSLREVARRLGVSHQAPYRHYPSRDHLLAEVVERCFNAFDAWIARAPVSDDPHADLLAAGRLYLQYSAAYPLEYRLMFGSALPDPKDHPRMLDRGCGAFDQLRGLLARVLDRPLAAPEVTLEAMFVWSTLHGIATIRQTDAMTGLMLDPELQDGVTEFVLMRLDRALRACGDRAGARPEAP